MSRPSVSTLDSLRKLRDGDSPIRFAAHGPEPVRYTIRLAEAAERATYLHRPGTHMELRAALDAPIEGLEP
jgi:hypothetical protein